MKSFQRALFLCILCTYLVILAGAIVRGTGSGLGCPDWPRCFGSWVPPTDISQLPANYKEIYKIAGKTIADFDPFKTWTEYINRLLGALLGFFMIGLFALSFRFRQQEKNLPWHTGGLLLLVMVQGGVGALVVSTHLKPFIITIHMFLAIVLLFGLLYLRKYCKDLDDRTVAPPVDKSSLRLTRYLIGFTFIQVILGTRVREQVDHLIRDTMQAVPATVIDHLGVIFLIHRSFSFVILGMFIYLLFHLNRNHYNRSVFFQALFAFLCIIGNIVTGITLNYFGFPASSQPPHLFFGILALGLLYSLSLKLRGSLLSE